MSGWRCAFRIARRSMRRNLKRSILISSLIAVPIAGATVMDGLLQTVTGGEHAAYQMMGTADATAEVTGQESLPDWAPGDYESAEAGDRDPRSVDLAGLLPPGSRVVPDNEFGMMRVTDGDRVMRIQVDLVAAGDPLAEHQARLESGRFPDRPGEAAVTEPLAERLGLLDGDQLRDGATVTAEDGPTVTVTGLVVTPTSLGRPAVVAPPDSVLRDVKGTISQDPSVPYLVDLPPGADADALWPKLAEQGITFTPRAVYTDPDRYPRAISDDEPIETIGPVALIVGFGLLEVVLLAGAAFAVGARRQVRELGLIAANGGTGKHIGRTVLAEGVVLGGVGAVGGLLLGVLLIFAGWPLWEQVMGEVIDGWRFGWPELTVACVVAVLSGAGAALLPAIGVARMQPADALAQRFRTTRLSGRLPLLGLVLLGVGVAGVVAAGLLARHDLAAHEAAQLESEFYTGLDLIVPALFMLAAALVAVVGLGMSTSGVIAMLGRVAGGLPLSGRLAVRDAGRHRHRTVPAVAAIMVVVAGSVSMAFVIAAGASDESRTQPPDTLTALADRTLVYGDDAEKVADARRELATGGAAIAAELPEGRALKVPTVSRGSSPVLMEPWRSNTCVLGEVGIAEPAVMELALGRAPDADLRADLDRGKVVAVDECYVQDGTAGFDTGDEEGELTELPARYVSRPEGTSYFNLPSAFVSEQTAREQGWTVAVDTLAVRYAPSASADDLDAAIVAGEDHGVEVWQPYDAVEEANLINLALVAGAGLVTLLGVAVTIALSAAESRDDLATLSAIGAQPRRRRTFAGAQALVLSGLGTALGLLLGVVLGFSAIPLSGESALVVPWTSLALTVVGVPLLAMAVAMATTRSKLPMVRRLE
ncbi:MAG: FtsX-like permease family protein [Actinophytocola sp.]|uniref:FtsX-like permease family protein n=1 Tax=Actinophytocola sp. TaxID=1872138 RepID=UPI003D6B9CD3